MNDLYRCGNLNYNTGLIKISSKNKVSYFVAVIGVNFFAFVSIFMIVQMIVEEHKPIFHIYYSFMRVLYIYDVCFCNNTKNSIE